MPMLLPRSGDIDYFPNATATRCQIATFEVNTQSPRSGCVYVNKQLANQHHYQLCDAAGSVDARYGPTDDKTMIPWTKKGAWGGEALKVQPNRPLQDILSFSAV